MTEISEEMQMKIFDLLEGNLSKTEADQILMEINRSDVLKEEYQLMQMTYLPKEDEVALPLPFRKSLYRRATIIPLGLFARAAAVVCLIGAGSYVFYNTQQDQIKEQIPKQIANNEGVKNDIIKPIDSVITSDEDGNMTKSVSIIKSKIQNNNPNYSTIKRKNITRNYNDSDIFRNVVRVKPNANTDTFAPVIAPVIAGVIAGVDVGKNNMATNTKSNKRSWNPVEVILIDEPMRDTKTNTNSQASLASRFFKSTKEHIRRGQTPDIDIKFNRRKLKFDFDFVSHL